MTNVPSDSYTEPGRLVLISDHTWPSVAPEADVLARVGARVVVAPSGEEPDLVALAGEVDGILTCFAPITRKVIESAPRLQVIGRYGIGVDNIDVEAASRRGIPVTNVPAYCVDEVAEHALALMLGLARSVLAYDRAVHEGDWSLTRGAPVYRVAGRTLGIIGMGKIGRKLCAKSLGLGLRVLAYDHGAAADAVRAVHAEPASLAEIAARSDFLSLHLPLTAATRHIVDEALLRSMKPTAFLINTARGPLVDREALLKALREGWIAGAGIDVFEPERLPADDPLLDLPNVIATPHVAFYSEQSVLDLELQAAENVAAILAGRRPASLVNPEVLELPRWPHLR